MTRVFVVSNQTTLSLFIDDIDKPWKKFIPPIILPLMNEKVSTPSINIKRDLLNLQNNTCVHSTPHQYSLLRLYQRYSPFFAILSRNHIFFSFFHFFSIFLQEKKKHGFRKKSCRATYDPIWWFTSLETCTY